MKSKILLKIMYLITFLIVLLGIIMLVLDPKISTLFLTVIPLLFTLLTGLTYTNLFVRKTVLFTNFPISNKNNIRNEFDIVEFNNKFHDLVLETKESIKKTEDIQKQIQKLKSKIKSKYIANSKTGRYHLANCRFVKIINKANKVSLKTKTYAKKHKFIPCSCIQ